MRVRTDQSKPFADQFIQVPDTELDSLDSLIDWSALAKHFDEIKGDYSAISLFKVLLLQTWYKHGSTCRMRQ